MLDAMARLRQIYPNILGIQPAPIAAAPTEGVEAIHSADLSPDSLFRSFFAEVQGRPMDAEEAAVFLEVSARVLVDEVQP